MRLKFFSYGRVLRSDSWRVMSSEVICGIAQGAASGVDTRNKKGPPCGEPFSVLRMVRHQESKKRTFFIKYNEITATINPLYP